MIKIKISLSLIVLIFISSCKKYNSENCEADSKYYRTETSIHCIKNGYLFFSGRYLNFENSYLFNIIITGDNVIYDLTDSVFSSKGDALSFTVLCNSSELLEGTYTFDMFATDSNIVSAGHFENYDFTKHYSINDPKELPGDFANITEGSLVISEVDKDNYSMSYSCIDENGDSITGKYIGNLFYIDSSD